MKIEWEEADVIAGRHVRQAGCNETWIIGYEVPIDRPNVYGVGSLRDGMFRAIGTKAEVAADLNKWAHPVEVLEWNERHPVKKVGPMPLVANATMAD